MNASMPHLLGPKVSMELNDEIEKLTGEYINTPVYKYSIYNFDNNKHYITSIESYKYSKCGQSILRNYEEQLPDITEQILKGYKPKEYEDLYELILNSPKLEIPVIIYIEDYLLR